jgi:hypothetical protein
MQHFRFIAICILIFCGSLVSKCQFTDEFNYSSIVRDPEAEKPDSPNLITIPQPVMQRLIEGKTRGLAIKPLGAVIANIHSSEAENPAFRPMFHYNAEH